MKKTIAIIVLLFFSAAFAQKDKVKKADKFFKERSYVKAAALYEQLPQQLHVLQNLADAYFFNARMSDAANTYEKLFALPNYVADSPYVLRYAQALMALSQYSQADLLMSKYLGYSVDTAKFIADLSINQPFTYTIQAITAEDKQGAFGIAPFGQKVVFSTFGQAAEVNYQWNDKPYLDLYQADLTEDGKLLNVEPLPQEINSEQHESNATFSADGKTMYFNRTSEERTRSQGEKVAQVKIMKAVFSEGIWQVIDLPFSSSDYSVEHPCLSKDGKRLYFASDMPGSIGSFDLYVIDINDDGTWGKPINLGPQVNTKQKEQFPFISDEGILYFSSDGHQGLGGLDIFSSTLTDHGFSSPINLGPSLNSGLDDFSYILQAGSATGFISSNRHGTDQLFRFRRSFNQKAYFVEGDIKDKTTKELLPGTKVSLFDENGDLVAQIVAGESAQYRIDTKPDKKYRIEAVRDFYVPYAEYFVTNSEGKLHYSIEMNMQRYEQVENNISKDDDGRTQIKLENIYFDLNDWKIKPKAAKVLQILVDLLKKYPDMEIELGAHTDTRADDNYNLKLSEKRAEAAVAYIVEQGIASSRLKYRGYGETRPVIPCGKKCSDKQHAINRRCEFVILK